MQMEAPPGSVSSRVQLSSLLSAVQTSLAELKVEVASARKLSREATACAESPRSVSQLVNPAAATSSPMPRCTPPPRAQRVDRISPHPAAAATRGPAPLAAAQTLLQHSTARKSRQPLEPLAKTAQRPYRVYQS